MRLLAFLALAWAIASPAAAATCFNLNGASLYQLAWPPSAPAPAGSWAPCPSSVPPAGLAAAIAAAKPGETIRVSAGAPANVIIRGRAFAPPLTITSADPAHPALLDGLQLIGSAGFIFDTIDVTLANPAMAASPVVAVTNSSGIVLKGVNVTGSADPTGKCGWFGKGVAITGGDHISFLGGSISKVNKGFSLGGGQYVTLQGANLHNVNTSPVDGGGDAAHLQFLDNFIHDLVPVIACGQHSDGWHMWSKNSHAPIDDVLVRGNTFTQAQAGGSPALSFEGTPITVGGAVGPGFTNVVVNANTFHWNNNQGISTNWVQGTFTNNLLLPTPVLDNPAHAPGFIERQGSKFVVTDNTLKCGPSMKPYPNNTCLTAEQIAKYGGLAPPAPSK